MSLTIDLDPKITFRIGERELSIDILEFEDWRESLYTLKGTEREVDDGAGNKSKLRELPSWALIVDEVQKWAGDRDIRLTYGEAKALWLNAHKLAEAKKKSWDASDGEKPNSPSSTDPRYADN